MWTQLTHKRRCPQRKTAEEHLKYLESKGAPFFNFWLTYTSGEIRGSLHLFHCSFLREVSSRKKGSRFGSTLVLLRGSCSALQDEKGGY